MNAIDIDLSRISKFFADRDQENVTAALARRQNFGVTLVCGNDVAGSYTLQLAVLTAARIAVRCFPGAVRVALSPALKMTPLRIWPSLEQSFGQALSDILGAATFLDLGGQGQAAHTVLFGNVPEAKGALRVTFDGWIAKVGPAQDMARLPEREYCSLTGILASSLALSELFLSFAEINVEATRRVVAVSLWRPDLDAADQEALGVNVEHLPRELWVLGLGHLGNAYLWALATLPYAAPREIELMLNDFDKVESVNLETGIIFETEHLLGLKTRGCGAWLEARKFRTRLVERRFDDAFRCRTDEPRLALCGFDSNPVRRDLPKANFLRVIESGLGGTASNFDTISLHTLPNPRPADELWPDLAKKEEEKRIEQQKRVANENTAYLGLDDDECGRYELAGKSVAVPFVGTTAASFVVAEVLRLLHSGPAYTDIKLRLSAPGKPFAQRSHDYVPEDHAGVKFALVNS